MGKKHRKTDFDKARDELMSLVHRCNVLQAEETQRNEWLKETVEYMAERFPGMSKMELAQLEIVGRRFCQPVIAHGADSTALNRDESDEAEQDGMTEAPQKAVQVA